MQVPCDERSASDIFPYFELHVAVKCIFLIPQQLRCSNTMFTHSLRQKQILSTKGVKNFPTWIRLSYQIMKVQIYARTHLYLLKAKHFTPPFFFTVQTSKWCFVGVTSSINTSNFPPSLVGLGQFKVHSIQFNFDSKCYGSNSIQLNKDWF